MNDSWIVDVLADLKRFSRLNGRDRLADEIARTEALARHEFAGPEASGDPPREAAPPEG